MRKYKELIKGLNLQKMSIPDAKVIYPKKGIGSENLFGIYNVYFHEGKTQKTLSFESSQQLELFEFLNSDLELKNIDVQVPKDAKDCRKVLKSLKQDYDENISSIKVFLKSNRSKANHLSIYRDLILRK